MRVLAGDIGGTNARLTVFTVESDRYEAESEQVFPSPEYASLVEIVSEFVRSHDVSVRTACFGVPGPVRDGRAEVTNLPWAVESAKLADAVGAARVAVINDLEAQALGIATLGPADFAVLNDGAADARGNAALIALELFVELYGAEAGNLALKIMAEGGVYLGGGIAPQIVEKLKEGAFMDAFLDKGRMRPLLEAVPVRVILREGTALRGAARYAALLEAP